MSKPGGGGGIPKPEDGGGGGGAGGGERCGRELDVGEAMGGAGGGWLGLSRLTRFWVGAPYCPSLYAISGGGGGRKSSGPGGESGESGS